MGLLAVVAAVCFSMQSIAMRKIRTDGQRQAILRMTLIESYGRRIGSLL